ncbi:hypothetical protein [Streptomyces showdoensis]|nr:hypothetical protein [Streptomyces showdoensis]
MRAAMLNGVVARRSKARKKPSLGVPREIILLTGAKEWPYTVAADDGSGVCGKVPLPCDALPEDVQERVFTPLAELTRAWHGIDIDVTWSPLTQDSWVGRITRGDGTPPVEGGPA